MIYLFSPNRKVLSILEEDNLQILVNKYQFYIDTIDFLGYKVWADAKNTEI